MGEDETNETVLAVSSEFSADPKQCSAHSTCAHLDGDCCPGKDGKYLDCCHAECSRHSKCEALEGYCCPNTDGVMLECCEDETNETTPLTMPNSPLGRSNAVR